MTAVVATVARRRRHTQASTPGHDEQHTNQRH